MQDETPPTGVRALMTTEAGTVWFVPEGSYFWIRFGNIRWRMDAAAFGPWHAYLQSVSVFLATREEPSPPAYLRTKDSAVHLAFSPAELRDLLFLLEASATIFAIEQGPASPTPSCEKECP